ncbi:hypothetical protein CATMQ487_02050 [Sphaerotilus microaerophilus]|uniref:Uncharacterized protein n=1 Tax=Sphaerotilus microaerophilus TaxID=2914710 RepID=A0ABN6PI03_9BURK|nr:hypothetical protein CATMQ487_02050 [Sphaerotilus sp. FB-5]
MFTVATTSSVAAFAPAAARPKASARDALSFRDFINITDLLFVGTERVRWDRWNGTAGGEGRRPLRIAGAGLSTDTTIEVLSCAA